MNASVWLPCLLVLAAGGCDGRWQLPNPDSAVGPADVGTIGDVFHDVPHVPQRDAYALSDAAGADADDAGPDASQADALDAGPDEGVSADARAEEDFLSVEAGGDAEATHPLGF